MQLLESRGHTGVTVPRLMAELRPAHLEVIVDPNPDYDASDEIEYFFNFVPWGLRGVYPPPAYPPV